MAKKRKKLPKMTPEEEAHFEETLRRASEQIAQREAKERQAEAAESQRAAGG